MDLEKPVSIPDRMFFRIGEVADLVGVKAYVLRYWETEFSFLSPQKKSGDRRLYTKKDVETALLIKHLLYDKKFSIAGAKKHYAELRRAGELGAAREIRVAISPEKFEALQQAKAELHAVLELCRLAVD